MQKYQLYHMAFTSKEIIAKSEFYYVKIGQDPDPVLSRRSDPDPVVFLEGRIRVAPNPDPKPCLTFILT